MLLHVQRAHLCVCFVGETDATPRWLQGLFFYHTRKVGFIVGAKWGSGFLFTRVSAADESPARWSAPVFYKVQEGSIGLTAGRPRLSYQSPSELRLIKLYIDP